MRHSSENKEMFAYGFILFLLSAVLSGCALVYSPKSVSPNALLYHGNKAFEEHRFKDAVNNYNEILSRYRNFGKNDFVLYRLGCSYIALGKFDDARRSFNTLCTNHPRSKYVEEANLWLKALGATNGSRTNNISGDEIESLKRENQMLKEQIESLKKLLEE